MSFNDLELLLHIHSSVDWKLRWTMASRNRSDCIAAISPAPPVHQEEDPHEEEKPVHLGVVEVTSQWTRRTNFVYLTKRRKKTHVCMENTHWSHRRQQTVMSVNNYTEVPLRSFPRCLPVRLIPRWQLQQLIATRCLYLCTNYWDLIPIHSTNSTGSRNLLWW